MSYDIVFQRAFVRVNEKECIPMVLMGCNNLTELCYDRNGRPYERRVRNWGTLHYVKSTDNKYDACVTEEAFCNAIPDVEHEFFLFNSRFLFKKNMRAFIRNGFKQAYTAEDFSISGNNLRLEVIEYRKDKNHTQNLIYGKVVETTADLQKAVEEARDVMKEYNGGEMLVMDVTTFYDEQVSRWSA